MLAPYRRINHVSTVLIASAVSFLLGRHTAFQERFYASCLPTLITACARDKTLVDESQKEKKDTGWHQIDVFFGESSHLETLIPSDKEWTSQVDQDRTVFRLLNNKTGGYFVDLAANDATDLSNTYTLESRYGWHGLCIEANFIYWHGLASRPRCQVVGAVVGHETMAIVDFTFARGVYGGIIAPGFDNKGVSNAGKGQGVEQRYTVTLSDVFERYNVPPVIDYFSLDVEGAESYIMNDFPFEQYTVKIMTVERPKDDLKEILRKNGYVFVKEMVFWGEKLYCHQSFLSSLNFSAAGIDPPANVTAY